MTKEKLESIYYLTQELEMWQKRYKELQLDIAPPVKNIDGMPFSHSTESPVERKALKMAETTQNIEDKMKEINEAIIEVEHFIVTVDDPLMRQILEYRCVYNHKWAEIAYKIKGTTEEALRQQYHRFVREL